MQYPVNLFIYICLRHEANEYIYIYAYTAHVAHRTEFAEESEGWKNPSSFSVAIVGNDIRA